jgi:AhpD family alkylhydroperoxidase
MSHSARISLHDSAPGLLKSMTALSMTVMKSAIGGRLIELVQLRISQINGCGFCVDMHWRKLLQEDANPRHLNAVAVWREAPFFSERERAALAWAEAINALPQRDDTEPAYEQVRRQFSEQEIVELSYAVAVIRGWNMLNLGLRSQIPEVPAPGY